MANRPQLEVISPGGEITFYDLDGGDLPSKGVTNIGRHPDNDIVIDHPDVALFHAVLYHGQRTPAGSTPFRLVVLNAGGESSQAGQVMLGGRPLSAEGSHEIHDWDALDIAGYTLILAAGYPALTGGAVSETASTTAQTQALAVRGTAALATFFYDQTDDMIVTEVSAREWTVNVEETATCQVTIVNGGEIVAGFEVHVEGLDASWATVTVSPDQINLYEGGRAAANVMITPARSPQSAAGPHPLAIVVTSPNYPGHVSRTSATLTINPFYEFSVSELSRRRQTVPWGRHYGETDISLENRGNSQVTFLLEGTDDERACSFEFQVPGQIALLTRQASLRMAPDETVSIPIHVTPLKRKLIAARGRTHPFTITASMLAGEQSPRTVMGEVRTSPLFGPLHVILAALLLFALVVILTRPKIYSFAAADNGIALAGDPVKLNWRVSAFSTNLKIDGITDTIPASSEWISVVPEVPGATYVLRANNLFSSLFARFGINMEASRNTRVLVLPRPPLIESFTGLEGEKKWIQMGDSVTVKWAVSTNATELRLLIGNDVEKIPIEEYVGQRVITPSENTLLVLEASNASGTDLRSTVVIVYHPRLLAFDAQPTEITVGESVTLTWDVLYANEVSIAPLPDPYPAAGALAHKPAETTQYVLTYKDGTTEMREMREVIVHPAPTPTPLPLAPTIEFFTTAPEEVPSSGGTVQLAWSVLGETTDIQITSLNSYNASQLQPSDILTIDIDEPTLLVLTAFNGELSASKTVEVKVAQVTPSPTPILPQIVFFKAVGDKDYEDKVVFTSQEKGSSGAIFKYTVPWGTKILLNWETKNGDTVTLNDESQPPAGQAPKTITAPVTYKLVAKNAAGSATAYIQINVTWTMLPNKIYLPMVLSSYTDSSHIR